MAQMFAGVHFTLIGRVIAITVACLLFLGAQWSSQLHHLHLDGDCHDQVCIACHLSTEAVSVESTVQSHVAAFQVTHSFKATSPVTRLYLSRLIRAPPII